MKNTHIIYPIRQNTYDVKTKEVFVIEKFQEEVIEKLRLLLIGQEDLEQMQNDIMETQDSQLKKETSIQKSIHNLSYSMANLKLSIVLLLKRNKELEQQISILKQLQKDIRVTQIDLQETIKQTKIEQKGITSIVSSLPDYLEELISFK